MKRLTLSAAAAAAFAMMAFAPLYASAWSYGGQTQPTYGYGGGYGSYNYYQTPAQPSYYSNSYYNNNYYGGYYSNTYTQPQYPYYAAAATPSYSYNSGPSYAPNQAANYGPSNINYGPNQAGNYRPSDMNYGSYGYYRPPYTYATYANGPVVYVNY